MKPLVISVGDPSGIGPEITLRALSSLRLKRPVLLYGDRGVLTRTARALSQRNRVREGFPPPDSSGGMYAIHLTDLPEAQVRPGTPSLPGARSTLAHLEGAVDIVSRGIGAALVTAPIHKGQLAKVGFEYPGHTEFLAARTGAKSHAMMLAGGRLRVVLASIHVPLARVSSVLTTAGILEKIVLTRDALRQWFGMEDPRIAVLGLNPHAGEGGLFGLEERKIITPAIRRARRRGWAVSGPYPADGFFGRYDPAQVDAVIAMYHDQGLIPLKLLHFRDGVNITLGLPIIRTSPDHGTAYDIAGTGKADATSMREAIRAADRFATASGR